MTEENKQLLLVDLSTRLPYGVIVVLDEKFGFNKGTRPLVKELLDLYCVEGMKPYLRPMSSMTEDEKKEFDKILNSCNDKVFACPEKERRYKFFDAEQEDFMNAHHFDYRMIYDEDKKKYMSMIEKGLALKAPEGMYI